MAMHDKPYNKEAIMWDVYNAQGAYGGKDVTEAVRHYDIPDGVKISIINKIRISSFLTPNEIDIFISNLMVKLKSVTSLVRN